MKCPKCGHDLSDDALFCSECGSAIEQSSQEALSSSEKAEAMPAKPNQSENATEKDSNAATSSNESENSSSKSDTKQSDAHEAESESNQIEESSNVETSQKSDNSAPETSPSTLPGSSSSKSSVIDKFKALDKKVRYGIIGGAAVVIIALIAIIGGGLFGGVPTDVAKQAFINQSSLATSGAVSSQYTNETPYEITEFRIDSEENYPLTADEQQILNRYFNSNEARAVTCSGKVANESFETEFSAVVAVIKVDGSWQATEFTKADILSENTVPLKGVDTLSTSSNSNASYSDFSSSLDESNGTYTSSASGTVSYDYWFGTDSATVSQTFTFDPSAGWKPAGDPEQSNETTAWNLEGTTYKASIRNGIVNSTLTLHPSENNTITADYTLGATVPSDSTKWFKDFSLSGTATGTLEHKFGTSSVSLTLEDSSNAITFDGPLSSSASSTTGADKSTYRAHVTADTVWYTGIYGDGKYDETFDEYLTFESSNSNDTAA